MGGLLRFVGLIVSFFAVLNAAHSAVTEKVIQNPYVVTGKTEDEVRADINAKRNGNYDATAKWWIRWNFWYRTSPGQCAIARIATTLELTFVEPKLITSEPSVQKSFDDYMVKLRTHEQGHADIAREVARRIDAAIPPLTAPTCDELGKNANALAHSLIREGNTQQEDYDARTNHGATQGARWPLVITPPARDRSQYQHGDGR